MMRKVIISDFDETITREDTITVLGKIPYHIKPGLTPSWDHFSSNYYDCWKKYHSKNQDLRRLPLLSSHVRNQGIHGGNYGSLFKDEIEYQRNNRVIELSSTVEMAKQKIFSGVTHQHVHDYVGTKLKKDECVLREGVLDCIDNAVQDPRDFYILSVNWSPEFIDACIGTGKIPKENIICNRLLSDEDATYTGEFENEVLCGSDKIVKLQEIINKRAGEQDHLSLWYIGDSDTDILAILHHSINGILLVDPEENASKFKKLAEDVLGVDKQLLDSFTTDSSLLFIKCLNKDHNNSLYLAKSWKGVQQILNQN